MARLPWYIKAKTRRTKDGMIIDMKVHWLYRVYLVIYCLIKGIKIQASDRKFVDKK